MRHAAVGRIGAELGLVLLVLLSLLTGYGLVRKAYESVPERAEQVAAAAVAAAPAPPSPAPPPAPEPPPAVAEAEPPDPEPDPEPDPTAVQLERLNGLAQEQGAAARAADGQTARQLAEIDRLETERRRWSQRTALVKERSRQLDRLVTDLEKSLSAAEQQRASLTRTRDEQAQALALAQSKGKDNAYAVTPYKGPSGTWRRPIVIDCSARSVQVLPDGRVYGSVDLGPIPNSRAISLVYEVRKKAAEQQEQLSPDGAPSVSYILFLVRPDGIRHYYEARTLLESSGIAFGYELIGQDWVVDVPEARGKTGVDSPQALARADRPASGGRGSNVREPGAADDLYVWPADSLRAAGGRNSAGPLAEFPGSPGTPRNTASASRPGGAVLEPADLFEPPIRQVPDPRRQSTEAPELVQGYKEIIPGQTGRPDTGSGASGSADRPAPRPNPAGAGLAASGLAQTPGPGRPQAGTLRPGGQPNGSRALAALPGSRSPGSPPGLATGSPLGSSTEGPTGARPFGGSSTVRAAPEGRAGATNAPTSGTNPNALPKAPEDIPPLGSGTDPTGPASPGDWGLAALGGSGGSTGSGTGGQPGQTAPGGSAGGTSGATGSGSGSGTPGQTALGSSAGGSTGSGTGSNKPGQTALGGSSGGASSDGAPGSDSGGQPGQRALGGSAGGSSSATGSAGSQAGAQAGSHWLSTPGGASGLPPKMSDEWLDLVVACQPHGVTIQPGGYRLSRSALTSGTLLIDRLRAIVQRAGVDERGRMRRPRIRFVVEAGGQEAFWLARRQTSFVGLDWPATLQLAESIRWDGWSAEEVRR